MFVQVMEGQERGNNDLFGCLYCCCTVNYCILVSPALFLSFSLPPRSAIHFLVPHLAPYFYVTDVALLSPLAKNNRLRTRARQWA
jgi:hypothetical protein